MVFVQVYWVDLNGNADFMTSLDAGEQWEAIT